MPDVEMLEIVKAVLDLTGISQADKSFVIASMWTCEEVPSIKSTEQYEVYKEQADAIEKEHGTDRKGFFRTKPGMLCTALNARIVEWDKANNDV